MVTLFSFFFFNSIIVWAKLNPFLKFHMLDFQLPVLQNMMFCGDNQAKQMD